MRHAIGELQAEKYLERIKGSGTFISGKLKGKTKTIGVVTTYDNYIFQDIIKGIDQTLSKYNYGMMLGLTHNSVEREAEVIENMINRDVDGIIIETSKSAFPNLNIEMYEKLKIKGIPYILINGYYRELDCARLLFDDVCGGYLAAMHLIENGHRDISGLFKVDDIQGHRRYLGFVKALREKDIPLKEDLIDWFTTENFDEITTSNGLLKKLKKSSAVICYNDQTALMVKNLLKKNDIIIGKDISLISFDDSKLAKLAGLEVTSIIYPANKFGQRAANNLIDLIKGKKIKKEDVIKAELIIRDSVVKL